jgi:monothiol glutaredoxin
MTKARIVAWLKPTCGWSQGVRAVLRKYDLPFEDRDVTNNPDFRREMVERSGQPLSPCVEVDGHMLADVSGSELEAHLLANHVVAPTNRTAEVPTDQPCAGESQAAPVACTC